MDDPGAKVACGSRADGVADQGNDPLHNGRGLSQAWVRGPVAHPTPAPHWKPQWDSAQAYDAAGTALPRLALTHRRSTHHIGAPQVPQSERQASHNSPDFAELRSSVTLSQVI